MENLKEWVKRISRLALIEVSEDEVEPLLRDILKIIDFFNKLREVNVEGIEPLFMTPREKPVVREDEVSKGLSSEEALANAKETVDNYFKAPKTV